MRSKKVKSIFVIFPCVLIGIGLLVFASRFIQSRQIGKLAYVVDPYDQAVSKYLPNTCKPVYYDHINLNAKDDAQFSEISVHVGKAVSPEDVVEKWTNNVSKLKKQYEEAVKGKWVSRPLYGNFLWTKRPKHIRLRYRTSKAHYPREGWYIFTSAPHCALLRFDNDPCYGQFFLSDHGILTIAVDRSSLFECN